MRFGNITYQEKFVTLVIRVGVLTFGGFTTKSDCRAPYFINTGNYKAGTQAARLGDYHAAYIQQNLPDGVDCLFGPAYKGVSPAISAIASLYRSYGRDLPHCFNRKEAKDHGEGGVMVGYKPQNGDRVVITENVVTASTAVQESIELLQHMADIKMCAFIVSVDWMERGIRACSILDELREDYGVAAYPIVIVREIIAFLHNREFDGRAHIDGEMKSRMEVYLKQYDAR